MVLVPPRLLRQHLFTEIELWWWCLHLPGRPFPATNTNQETYSFLKLNKLVVSSRAHSRNYHNWKRTPLFSHLSPITGRKECAFMLCACLFTTSGSVDPGYSPTTRIRLIWISPTTKWQSSIWLIFQLHLLQ